MQEAKATLEKLQKLHDSAPPSDADGVQEPRPSKGPRLRRKRSKASLRSTYGDEEDEGLGKEKGTPEKTRSRPRQKAARLSPDTGGGVGPWKDGDQGEDAQPPFPSDSLPTSFRTPSKATPTSARRPETSIPEPAPKPSSPEPSPKPSPPKLASPKPNFGSSPEPPPSWV